MDEELADAAACAPSRRYVCIHHEAVHFCRHPDTMTSNRKSDTVNRCIFSWRTFLLNFIPIRFKRSEPYVFWTRRRATTRWIAIWDQFL